MNRQAASDHPVSDRAVTGSGHEVKPYDFRRPDRFSKESLRALRIIHEAFCRLLTSSLSSYLRANVQVRLRSIEQLVYSERVQCLEQPKLISVVNLKPLPGRAFFDTDLNIAFVMLDRLLGGRGADASAARELTDIEYSLFRRLIVHILRDYRSAWQSVVTLEPEPQAIILNSQFVQIATPEDSAVLARIDVRLFDQTGEICFCVPQLAIEPVSEQLSAQVLFSTSRRGEATQNPSHLSDLQRRLQAVSLEMDAELGRARLTLREVMALKVGSVVRLDTKVDDELIVHVEGKAKHLCRPGLLGRSRGIQITRTIEEVEAN